MSRKTGDRSAVKNRLFIQQGGTCIYCDKRFYDKSLLTIEHIVPGFNHPRNLVLACKPCNMFKSNLYLMDNPAISKHMSEEMLSRILIMQLFVLRTFIQPLIGE